MKKKVRYTDSQLVLRRAANEGQQAAVYAAARMLEVYRNPDLEDPNTLQNIEGAAEDIRTALANVETLVAWTQPDDEEAA